MNAGVTLDPTGPLTTFLLECKDKTPDERADLLASTTLFADAHKAAATSAESSSVVPQDLSTDLHFTAFVQAPSAENSGESRVVELDGRRPCPIDHGPSHNLLKDVAKIVKEKYITLSTSMHFGLVALSGQ
ncbi:ubiquitinyl hydrolase 1 [Tulasnella sp. 419]|nr:ubiquitinyl hydrolase 1 [Tulasnella sp. 419]